MKQYLFHQLITYTIYAEIFTGATH
jgi:hypothetical protein